MNSTTNSHRRSGLLTPAEARQLLAIGRTKFYQLIAAGELRHVRIGRSIRISSSDLDAYLALCSRGGVQ